MNDGYSPIKIGTVIFYILGMLLGPLALTAGTILFVILVNFLIGILFSTTEIKRLNRKSILIEDHLMVGLRPLTPPTLVRPQFLDPNTFNFPSSNWQENGL